MKRRLMCSLGNACLTLAALLLLANFSPTLQTEDFLFSAFYYVGGSFLGTFFGYGIGYDNGYHEGYIQGKNNKD